MGPYRSPSQHPWREGIWVLVTGIGGTYGSLSQVALWRDIWVPVAASLGSAWIRVAGILGGGVSAPQSRMLWVQTDLVHSHSSSVSRMLHYNESGSKLKVFLAKSCGEKCQFMDRCSVYRFHVEHPKWFPLKKKTYALITDGKYLRKVRLKQHTDIYIISDICIICKDGHVQINDESCM